MVKLARAVPKERVLGVDPGSRRLGWGVIEREGLKLRAVAAGVLKLDADVALELRLKEIHEALTTLCESYAIDAMAVEDIFYAKFPNAAIKLGHVRGVVLLVGAQQDVPVSSYPPSIVKKTLAGRGAAEKVQVARLVAASLKLAKLPPADAADALAIAMTHCARAFYATPR
jgi:crossover junction endodeoxyribonuclease RuvC